MSRGYYSKICGYITSDDIMIALRVRLEMQEKRIRECEEIIRNQQVIIDGLRALQEEEMRPQ